MGARVTIITPCYNGELYLQDYFESILSQTYENVELVFVNDGSTDQTEVIANSYRVALEDKGYLFKYVYQENGGQAKAMNAGFKFMTGKYLMWPDSDDTLAPDTIEKRVLFLETHPEYDFVRSGGYYFDADTGKRTSSINFSYYNNPYKTDIFLDLIEELTFCVPGCYMIKTDMFREIYPERKIYETDVGQNWQILIPIAGRGSCGYINEEQYHVAVHEDSHSRRKRSFAELERRQKELKKVLEIGISKANRSDMDYLKVVDTKYNHVFLRLCIEADKKEDAKKYYSLLKKEGELSRNEKGSYLKKWQPFKYALFNLNNRTKSILRKIMYSKKS